MAQTPSPPSTLGLAIARVLDARGLPSGTAFLAAPNLLMTAAHVVNLALGQSPGTVDRPTSLVELDFPLSAPGRRLHAEIEHWVPPGEGETGDIAVLRLTEAPAPPVSPPPIVEPETPFGLMGTVLGFPARANDGVWSIVRIRGRQATGWTQIDLDRDSQFPVEQGFSGAPVWDPARGTIVGMVTHAWRGGGVKSAYMVSADGLFAACPELRELARPPSPFPGLRAFDESDTSVFFGRRDLVDQIVRLSAKAPIITVTGGSGAGKSSLLAAGVVPELRDRGDALVVKCVPHEAQTPLRALALALAAAADTEASATQRLETASLFAAMIQQERIAEVVTALVDASKYRQLVLIVDQFEQVLTAEEDQTAAFGKALSALTATENRPCLILSVRDDFLPTVARSRNLSDLTAQAFQIPIADLNADELREAIEGPLRLLPSVQFEPTLIDRLIADVEGQPGRMPLVQFALAELWDRQEDGVVRYEAYRALGDIRLMLSEHADRVWQGLSSNERELARRLLSQLVHPVQSNERVFTRRIVAHNDISPELWSIACRLAGDRLVVLGDVEYKPGRTETAVELAHESLIVHWQTLLQIAREDRDFRLWQDGLRHRADRWASLAQSTGGGYVRQLLRPRLGSRPGRRGHRVRLLSLSELGEARHWRRRRADLSSLEVQYLEASRTRQAVVWTRLTALVAIASLLPLYLVVESNRERQLLQQEELSRELAVHSQEAAATDGVRARLLAAAAWEASHTDQAWLAMTNAAASQAIGLKAEGHDGPVVDVEFSPDGTQLASLAGDGSIAVWDTGAWKVRQLERGFEQRGIGDSEFSSDGSLFAMITGNGMVRLWRTADGSLLATWNVEYETVREEDDSNGEVSFSPDGTILAAGSQVIHLWDTADYGEITSFDARRTVEPPDSEPVSVRVGTMQFTESGQTMVTADHYGLVREWDSVTGEQLWSKQIYGTDNNVPVTLLRQDPSKPFEFASCELSCQVVDARSGSQREFDFFLPAGLTYSTDGEFLAVNNWQDGRIWQSDDPSRIIGAIPRDVLTADTAISSNGEIVAGATDQGIQLWTMRWPANAGSETGPPGAEAEPTRLVLTNDKGAEVWQLEEDWNPSHSYSSAWENSVASADNSVLADRYGGEYGNQAVEVVDADTGDQIANIKAEQGTSVGLIALSPEGNLLLLDRSQPIDPEDPSSKWEHSLELWDTSTGTLLHILGSEPTGSTSDFAFSGDGTTLATLTTKFASSSTDVRIWDTESGTIEEELQDTNSEAVSLALSPDGSRLAIGYNRSGFELRDLTTGESKVFKPQGSPWSGGEFAAMTVEFTPNGRFLAIASPGNGLIIWDTELEALATRFTGFSAGGLTFSSDGGHMALDSDPFFSIAIAHLDDPYNDICRQIHHLPADERRYHLGNADVEATAICA
ncbi:nSTAND1 domain-containing NTPase [Nocardiopsis sp. M1B1]|uniref:nSTAND1 domain-containing NTPase n=1 Tax=Nocardiopsis sp. M1B1 TaxID=3450454 RepID=UPI0040392F9F